MDTRRRLSRKISVAEFGSALRRASTASWHSVKTAFSMGKSSRRGSRYVYDEPEEVTVDAVRALVLMEISEDRSRFHEKDIEKVKNSDWFIQRFIDDAETSGKKVLEKNVVEAVINCLIWRNNFGINDFTAAMFPKEFFSSNIFSMAIGSDNKVVLYVRGKRYQKIDGWGDLILQFTCYLLEVEEAKFPDGKIQLSEFIDCTGCGYAQTDMNLTLKALPIALNYYPCLMSKAYIYQLPWLLKPMAQVAMAVLPPKYREMVIFLDPKNINQVFGKSNLPDYMGGPVETKNIDCPPDASSIEEVGKAMGISEANIKKMRKYHESLERCT